MLHVHKERTGDELAVGRAAPVDRKYGDQKLISDALSPNRMTKILGDARRLHKEEYDNYGPTKLNEIINSKCRAVKKKTKEE